MTRLQTRTSIALAAAVGTGAIVLGVYVLVLPAIQSPMILKPQMNLTFTQDNRTYDQAKIPMIADQENLLDNVIFTYLGNSTAKAGQCPPPDFKSAKENYTINEIKHFKATLTNGTAVDLDTCWPLFHISPTKQQPSNGGGVSVPLQNRIEVRWFDPNSRTAGIAQEPVYFAPGNTTFYYLAERPNS